MVVTAGAANRHTEREHQQSEEFHPFDPLVLVGERMVPVRRLQQEHEDQKRDIR